MTDNTTNAVTVLRKMMREIARHEIPSGETWAEACKIVGWPEPAKLSPGKPVSLLVAAASGGKRDFQP